MFVRTEGMKEGQAGPSMQLPGNLKRKATNITTGQDDDEGLFTPHAFPGPSKRSRPNQPEAHRPHKSQVRKDPIRSSIAKEQTPGREPFNSSKQQNAPSGKSAPGPQDDVVELSDDEEDGEVLVRFKFGVEKHPKIKKSAILPFVKEQAREIFLRRSKAALANGEENALKKTADVLVNYSKRNFARLYREDWTKQLRRCVASITKEVDRLKSLQDQLEWSSQEDLFVEHILKPKELDLQNAEDDRKKMAALIEFLENN